MRRSLLGIILLLSLILSTTITQAQGGLLVTILQTAKLRAGPGTEWKLMGTLPTGTAFLLDGRDPTGTWARGIDPNGQIGWVIGTALSATSDQVAALPSIWVDTPFTLSPPPGGSAPAQPAAPVQPAAPQAPASA